MTDNNNMNRRDFLKGITLTSLGIAMAAEELKAQTPAKSDDKPAKPVTCAVIGLGPQGRDVIAALAKMGPAAPIAAVCDTYNKAVFMKRAKENAPTATEYDDYKKVLDDKSIQAVIIATPSHKHKQIVLDAIAAGKHVYCEAPLASTIADAQAIAKAGIGAKTVFQAGMQFRSNKMHSHVMKFVKSQALGRIAEGRAQWHKKVSWRTSAPTAERERELNWRLFKESSAGLMGEVGIHQIDIATKYLQAQPVAVSGFGGIVAYPDGREVADTVQCVVEYPGGIRFAYDATLGNSFDGFYELFMGTDCAVIVRDQRAWMFKESDAAMLGWEVYAKKDKMAIGDAANGTGIALVADATKLMKLGLEPGKVGTDVSKTALYQSLEAFLDCVRNGTKPLSGALEGYQANMVAIKANEAVLTGNKIALKPEWFDPNNAVPEGSAPTAPVTAPSTAKPAVKTAPKPTVLSTKVKPAVKPVVKPAK